MNYFLFICCFFFFLIIQKKQTFQSETVFLLVCTDNNGVDEPSGGVEAD